MTGKFIVIEGIDGCGKTTQINYLAEWLTNSGLIPKNKKLHITKEPGGTSLGEELREILLSTSNDNEPKAITELLLYAADRAQHVSQIIQPALNQGDWVLSDRFSGSTLAYQGYGRGLDIKLINKLEAIATQSILPNLTILLEITASESIKRRRKIKNDRIEKEGLKFLENVALGFSKIAKDRNWNTIKASKNIKQISKEINTLVSQIALNS